MINPIPETSVPYFPDIREMAPPKYVVSPELMAEMKMKIMEWLNGDINDYRVDFKLETEDVNGFPVYVCFERYVANLRSCNNSWEEVHVASSCMWPETYAVTKRVYCDNRCVHKPKNEVTSELSFFHESGLKPLIREVSRIVRFEGDQGNE